MAQITHSSMRKPSSNPVPKQEAQPQTQQDFVVEDLSAYEGQSNTAEIPKTPEVKQVLDESARKRIEDLIFLGRTSKVVEVAGHAFEISTLSHKEHNSLMKELARVSNESADIWKIRIYTLSSAIRSVDGVDFDELDVGQEFPSVFDKKLYVLDNMQLRVIEQLFTEYGGLLEESEKVVTGDAIKKS